MEEKSFENPPSTTAYTHPNHDGEYHKDEFDQSIFFIVSLKKMDLVQLKIILGHLLNPNLFVSSLIKIRILPITNNQHLMMMTKIDRSCTPSLRQYRLTLQSFIFQNVQYSIDCQSSY